MSNGVGERQERAVCDEEEINRKGDSLERRRGWTEEEEEGRWEWRGVEEEARWSEQETPRKVVNHSETPMRWT